MSKPGVFKVHWVLAVMLTLLSACAPSSPMPIPDTTSEPFPASVTLPSTQSATATPDPIAAPHWRIAGTRVPQLPATIDPLTDNLPVLVNPAIHFSLSNLSTTEQAQVYAAVIRRLAIRDDSFGGTLPKPTLFILTTTNDGEGDYTLPTAEPQGIRPEVQRAIQDYTTDLSSEITWVAHRDEVKIDDQHMNVIDGVILTLGNILVGDDQRLYVAGSVFYTYAAAAGQTYVFELRDGQWVLVGRTNIMWYA